MKKILLIALVMVVAFSGCGNESKIAATSSDDSSATETSASESSEIGGESSTSSGEFEYANKPGSEESTAPPIKDDTLTQSLTTYMRDNYGGMGNPEFSDMITPWYPYIGDLAVYRDTDSYFGVLTLTESPSDKTLRLLLSQYYPGDALDSFVPIFLDTGAALGLDEIKTSIMGENLYRILKGDGSMDVHYASMFDMGIPVYDYLSDAMGVSRVDVMANIELCKGESAATIVLDGMIQNYAGEFEGLTMQKVKQIALIALSQAPDVWMKEMRAYDPNGDLIGTFDNLSNVADRAVAPN